mgnify:CR=1 FL=1
MCLSCKGGETWCSVSITPLRLKTPRYWCVCPSLAGSFASGCPRESPVQSVIPLCRAACRDPWLVFVYPQFIKVQKRCKGCGVWTDWSTDSRLSVTEFAHRVLDWLWAREPLEVSARSDARVKLCLELLSTLDKRNSVQYVVVLPSLGISHLTNVFSALLPFMVVCVGLAISQRPVFSASTIPPCHRGLHCRSPQGLGTIEGDIPIIFGRQSLVSWWW